MCRGSNWKPARSWRVPEIPRAGLRRRIWRRQLSETPPRVVRFSDCRHSLAVAPRILLSSPRYYREREEKLAPPGEQPKAQARQRGRLPKCEPSYGHIGNRMEALFQKELELKKYHHRFVPQLTNAPLTGSARLTYSTNGFWIPCTSLGPEINIGFERLWSEFPEYDCATIIPDPSGFALQLGRDFGNQYGDGSIRVDAVAILRAAKIVHPFIEAGAPAPEDVVVVRHGRVAYVDKAVELIERYPPELQSTVLPFVKRTGFVEQKEYRFTVSLGGEPKRQRICVDVSNELRGLVGGYFESWPERVRNSFRHFLLCKLWRHYVKSCCYLVLRGTMVVFYRVGI